MLSNADKANVAWRIEGSTRSKRVARKAALVAAKYRLKHVAEIEARGYIRETEEDGHRDKMNDRWMGCE